MKIKYLIILVGIWFLPSMVSAVTIYMESSSESIFVGDTIVVSAKINAEDVTINAVEGDILISSENDNLTVREFSLANSAFGLWPRTPSLSEDGRLISFVGGVPGGFNTDGATLFKIVFRAEKEGRVIILPKNMSVYVNDGKGTKLSTKTKDLILNIESRPEGVASKDEWQLLVSDDRKPPEDFIVVLGQDDNLFEGRKFAFFSAVDNQSGVSFYEVSENGAPTVRSGSTYVLQNQEGDVNLKVTAFDKAGNTKQTLYPQDDISWTSIILTILVIIILRALYKKLIRNKKNVSILLQK